MSQDFYQKVRAEIREWVQTKTGQESQWSEYLLLTPDLFHLLTKLALDKDVPKGEKAKIAATLAYFISPIDLIPEVLIGPLGYLDDVALAAFVLNSVIKNTDPAVVARHWAGEQNILELVQQIVDVASDMLGNKIWDKLKKVVGD